jgi:spermidine synthase
MLDVKIESLYGTVRVADEKISDGRIIRDLYIGDALMGQMYVDDEYELVDGWDFIGCMEYPFALTEIKNALGLGIGIGLFHKRADKQYDVTIDAIDINQKVIDAAEEYFNLKPSKTLNIFTDDGRAFLENTGKKYDLIVVDIYHHSPTGGFRMPSHVATKEFFELSKKHLTSGGIFVMNMAMEPESKFFKTEYKTISSVFSHIYAYTCANNQIIIATDEKYPFEKLPEWGKTHEVKLNGDEVVLTDEFAPINSFSELMYKNER